MKRVKLPLIALTVITFALAYGVVSITKERKRIENALDSALQNELNRIVSTDGDTVRLIIGVAFKAGTSKGEIKRLLKQYDLGEVESWDDHHLYECGTKAVLDVPGEFSVAYASLLCRAQDLKKLDRGLRTEFLKNLQRLPNRYLRVTIEVSAEPDSALRDRLYSYQARIEVVVGREVVVTLPFAALSQIAGENSVTRIGKGGTYVESSYYVIRVHPKPGTTVAEIASLRLGLDIWEAKSEHLVARASAEQIGRLRQLGFRVDILRELIDK